MALLMSAGGCAGEPTVLQPRLLEPARQVMQSVYRLDHARAEAVCRRMIADQPDEPLGYALLARTLWGKQLSAGQGMSIDRFAGSAFYSDARRQSIAVSPEEEQRFRAAGTRAVLAARQKLARDPRDLGVVFTLGFAYQTLASYEFSMKGNWWAAFKESEDALRFHRTVSARAPQFFDARLQQATTQYFVACIPWSVRWLPFVLGYRGSKSAGKLELASVAQRGVLLADDASTLLVLMHVYDREFDQADTILEQLRQKYPSNYLLSLELAGLALHVNRPRRAIAIYQGLLSRMESNPDALAGLGISALYWRLGVAARQAGDLDDSVTWLRQAVAAQDAGPRLLTVAHLEMGKTLDLRGQRALALVEYRIVAHSEDFLGSRQEAESLLTRPFRAPRLR
jgi:tetratricopeptide (TPR) repeat protein